HGLIRTHELERRDGTEPVSVANQAAAFDKISRSSRSTRFSRLSRVSSSRSLLVSPSLRSPVSSCACLTHCRMLSTDGSNSRANSFSDRPARASSTIRRRYSAGYGGCVFGIALLLAFLPNTLHETGSTPKNRTALCNQLRGLLRERGVAVRAGVAALKRGLPAALADESSELSGEMRELLCEMSQWLRTLEQRIASCEARITRKFKHDERCQRLAEVPGVGPLTATALVAAVGNAQRFRNGRELSAYLGLVPRQHSSGGKTVLLGITKRGDRYLRTLLIHGARSALRQCKLKGDARSEWAARISAARGPNVAAVAMA